MTIPAIAPADKQSETQPPIVTDKNKVTENNNKVT